MGGLGGNFFECIYKMGLQQVDNSQFQEMMRQQREQAEAEQGVQDNTEDVPPKEEPKGGSSDDTALIIMSGSASSLCFFVVVAVMFFRKR